MSPKSKRQTSNPKTLSSLCLYSSKASMSSATSPSPPQWNCGRRHRDRDLSERTNVDVGPRSDVGFVIFSPNFYIFDRFEFLIPPQSFNFPRSSKSSMQEVPPPSPPRRFNDDEGERDAAPPPAARLKAEIVGHPLFEQLLLTHVACLRVATPVDQLPRLDAQLACCHEVLSNYSGVSTAEDDASNVGQELHQFMVSSNLNLIIACFCPLHWNS